MDEAVSNNDKSNIKIILKKDEIIIKIMQEAKYEEVIKEIKEKIIKLKKLYKEEKTPIYVTGKNLDNEQMKEIEEIIKKEIDVKIDFDSPKELGLSGIKTTFEEDLTVSEVKFHKGSLRCGTRMEYEKSIVIIGDVNSGAEIIAGGNIVITGYLRGLAHAGAKGNKKAIICARGIETPQIRIANIVKELINIPEINSNKYAKQDYAYVDGDNIIIE